MKTFNYKDKEGNIAIPADFINQDHPHYFDQTRDVDEFSNVVRFLFGCVIGFALVCLTMLVLK